MDKAEEIAYRAYPIDKDMPSVQQGSLVIARKQLAIEIKQYTQQRENAAFKKGWKAAEKLNKWNANPQSQQP